MGYLSEIGLCLAAPAQAKLDESLLNLANEKGEGKGPEMDLIQGLFQKAELRQDDESQAIAYYWPSLKWYFDYPDVNFVETFLEGLPEEDYLFIRLGESDDDTETKGAFWDSPFQMSTIRAITFE